MSLPSYVVEGRAHLLARIILIFDLLLAAGFYLAGAPWLVVALPLIDLVLVVLYLRFVRRSPALLTLGVLAISALLLALAPFVLGASGLALWVLYPLLPAASGFVLGRRRLVWQMAAITLLIAAAGGLLLIRAGPALVVDLQAMAVLVGACAGSLGLSAWLTARAISPTPSSRDILGEPLTVVRGLLVVPLNFAVGGVQTGALGLELNDLKRRYSPRWIVIDLAPAGEVSRRDLNAVEDAGASVSTAHCTIVIARPPVDALSHLDIAQPVVGRIERFATVPQAVEAGLRRIGWAPGAEQAQRVATTY